MEEKALKNSIDPGIELLLVVGKCSGTVQAQMKAIGRISAEISGSILRTKTAEAQEYSSVGINTLNYRQIPTTLRDVNNKHIHKIVAG